MTAIPVNVSEAIAILNLPGDLAGNPVFTEHGPLVLARMQGWLTEDYYADVTGEDLEADDPLWIASRAAYAFLMLESTAEFLNLKTVGEGIVKSVGLDSAATELLSGPEIDAFKARLELRALVMLKNYLNDDGLGRLYELKPRAPRVIRVGVI